MDRKQQVGIKFDPALVQRLRNLVYWIGQGLSVNGIVEAATLAEVERLEREYQRQHGKPVPEAAGELPKSPRKRRP